MNEVTINKNAKLSQHFSLGELTKTSAKTPDGNIPSHVHIENLKNLCENWLEPLRQAQGPIIINSGYRSEAVNKAIGGVKGSNHLTGCAVDIHVTGMEQAIHYASILLDISAKYKQELTSSRVCSRLAESMQAPLCARSNADFDELLIERSRKGTYWLHFAVRPKDNRHKIRFLQT
jgi:hypothetical protein